MGAPDRKHTRTMRISWGKPNNNKQHDGSILAGQLGRFRKQLTPGRTASSNVREKQEARMPLAGSLGNCKASEAKRNRTPNRCEAKPDCCSDARAPVPAIAGYTTSSARSGTNVGQARRGRR